MPYAIRQPVKRQSFVVIVQSGLLARSFGPYRSFRTASGDATAWGGFVLPIEKPDAENPWDPTL